MDTMVSQRVLLLVRAADQISLETVASAAQALSEHAERIPISAAIFGPNPYYADRAARAQELAQQLRDFLAG